MTEQETILPVDSTVELLKELRDYLLETDDEADKIYMDALNKAISRLRANPKGKP